MNDVAKVTLMRPKPATTKQVLLGIMHGVNIKLLADVL